MEKGKVVLWGGIGGFLFSALMGILGGVSILTLSLRALLGGGFLALLLGGSLWIIERFLPELIQPMDGVKEGGNQIDLVIPEHNPHLEPKEEEGMESFEGSKGFEDFVEEVEEVSKPPSANLEQPKGDSSVVSPKEETIDELPDLGGFADAFEGQASPEVFLDGARPGKDVDKSLDGGDPAVLAKAIQTLLKKDKEG
ncbi:MAG: hypothetical protein N2442_00880 [Spirochaetes bacterium]|nr:hypothetical protein [Spirochaetota bacterium]